MAQIMSSGMCSAKPLNSLFQDQLVKDGFSEEFMFSLFRGWLAVSSINSLATSFRKGKYKNHPPDPVVVIPMSQSPSIPGTP